VDCEWFVWYTHVVTLYGRREGRPLDHGRSCMCACPRQVRLRVAFLDFIMLRFLPEVAHQPYRALAAQPSAAASSVHQLKRVEPHKAFELHMKGVQGCWATNSCRSSPVLPAFTC
jgi:hypothetical protein